MDWSKTKNILIATFILLNIFLLTAILYTNSGLRFQSEYIQYAKEYLVSRDIQIDGKVPDRSGRAKIINYSTRVFNYEKLSQVVFGHTVTPIMEDGWVEMREDNEKIIFNGEVLEIVDVLPDGAGLFKDGASFSGWLTRYLDSIGYSRNTLSLMAEETTDTVKRAEYVLKFKDGLLFDQEIIAELSREGVLTLHLTKNEPRQFIRSSYEIMSAYQVLVMSNLPGGTHIKSIDFGYKQVRADELYDSPVWRMVLNSGETLYFNTDTGEKLQ